MANISLSTNRIRCCVGADSVPYMELFGGKYLPFRTFEIIKPIGRHKFTLVLGTPSFLLIYNMAGLPASKGLYDGLEFKTNLPYFVYNVPSF